MGLNPYNEGSNLLCTNCGLCVDACSQRDYVSKVFRGLEKQMASLGSRSRLLQQARARETLPDSDTYRMDRYDAGIPPEPSVAKPFVTEGACRPARTLNG